MRARGADLTLCSCYRVLGKLLGSSVDTGPRRGPGSAGGGSPGVGGQHSPLKLGSVRSHVGLTKYWIKMHARMARTHSIPASAKATELRKNLRGTWAQGAPGAPPRPSALPRSFQRLPSALGT